MPEQFIFHMHRLNKHFGKKHVLKDIGLSFYPGTKIGIVGENGSGKSTIIEAIAGLLNLPLTGGGSADAVRDGAPDDDHDLARRPALAARSAP